MLLFAALVSVLLGISNAKPYSIDPQNVVTVPPNCPPGQEWVAGACRDVWRRISVDTSNIVARTCPVGQKYVKGKCRYVWFDDNLRFAGSVDDVDTQNVVQVPPNCRPGQVWINGSCRDVWKLDFDPQNVITVPPNCPVGQEYVNGQCRDVWAKSTDPIERFAQFMDDMKTLLPTYTQDVSESDHGRNVISVPNQCPAGFRPDALGICREVFDFRQLF